jgi:hypothetical protein
MRKLKHENGNHRQVGAKGKEVAEREREVTE